MRIFVGNFMPQLSMTRGYFCVETLRLRAIYFSNSDSLFYFYVRHVIVSIIVLIVTIWLIEGHSKEFPRLLMISMFVQISFTSFPPRATAWMTMNPTSLLIGSFLRSMTSQSVWMISNFHLSLTKLWAN